MKAQQLEDESLGALHYWYPDHAIDLKFGRECCSHDPISFHYVDEDLMSRLYHLVYACPKDEVGVASTRDAGGVNSRA